MVSFLDLLEKQLPHYSALSSVNKIYIRSSPLNFHLIIDYLFRFAFLCQGEWEKTCFLKTGLCHLTHSSLFWVTHGTSLPSGGPLCVELGHVCLPCWWQVTCSCVSCWLHKYIVDFTSLFHSVHVRMSASTYQVLTACPCALGLRVWNSLRFCFFLRKLLKSVQKEKW